MDRLQPFSPIDLPVSVDGKITAGSNFIELEFHLSDPQNLVLDSIAPNNKSKWSRADELWKSTCFEAFFGFQGNPQYWELNLSPSKHLWNLYSFDSYRSPQPPRRNDQFKLEIMDLKPTRIKCRLLTDLKLQNLEANLCSVIRTESGITYYSLRHASKPDFHWREGFRTVSE